MYFATPFYLIVLTIIGLNIVPGPTMVFVAHQTMQFGMRRALWSITGVQVGIVLHIIASLSGLSFFLLQSEFAFKSLRLLGGIFLIVLGISAILNSKKQVKTQDINRFINNNWQSFFRGALINSLNPKVILFFMIALPQFVNVQANNINKQLLLLGSLFLLTCCFMNLMISFSVFKSLNKNSISFPRLVNQLNYLASFIFISFGTSMVFF